MANSSDPGGQESPRGTSWTSGLWGGLDGGFLEAPAGGGGARAASPCLPPHLPSRAADRPLRAQDRSGWTSLASRVVGPAGDSSGRSALPTAPCPSPLPREAAWPLKEGFLPAGSPCPPSPGLWRPRLQVWPGTV